MNDKETSRIERSHYRTEFGKRLHNLPINVISIYLMLTIVLYAIDSSRPETRNPILLYAYLIASVALLNLGYRNEIKKERHRGAELINANKPFLGFSSKAYSIFLLISFVLLHMTLFERTGSFFFDFSTISDLGVAYLKNYYFVLERGRSIVEWLRVFLSSITLLYFAIGIVSWARLHIIQKVLFCYLVIGNVLLYLLSGVNKGFADTLIYLLAYLLIAAVRSDKTTGFTKQYSNVKKRIRKVLKAILLFGTVFVLIFTINIASRVGNQKTSINDGISYLCGYLTQGYTGLDYALEQPFDSTWGFGSSMYILQSTNKWFDTTYFNERTYLTKNENEFGWNQSIRWSSFFVWVGNDISLVGALALMYVIGKFLGRVWIESMLFADPYSIVLFALMVQLCFYIPANNQIVQTAEGLGGVISILILRYRPFRKHSKLVY